MCIECLQPPYHPRWLNAKEVGVEATPVYCCHKCDCGIYEPEEFIPNHEASEVY